MKTNSISDPNLKIAQYRSQKLKMIPTYDETKNSENQQSYKVKRIKMTANNKK